MIWSCGYETNSIPFKDHEGKVIPLQQKVPGSQFDVDSKCRICTADGAILMKSFGMGIGYSTRTNDGMMRPDAGKPNPRADSFSLYTGWVANRILMNILPKTLLEQKCQKSMRNNRKKAIENAMEKKATKSMTPVKQ